jgi:hypothetical protein
MSLIRQATVLTAAAVLAAGCGTSHHTTGLSSANAERMHNEVRSVRVAAAAGDRARSLTALDGLAATASHQARNGNISSKDLADISDQIAAARARIDVAMPAASTQPSLTPPSTDGNGSDKPGKDHGFGKPDKGNGFGKGKEKKQEELFRSGLADEN